MKNYFNKNYFTPLTSFFLFALPFFLSSCAVFSPQKNAENDFQSRVGQSFRPNNSNSLVIMPFDSNKNIALSSDELLSLSEKFSRNIEIGTNISVLNNSFNSRTMDAFSSLEKLPVSQTEKAIRFGRKLGAQSVMHGIITRYSKSSDGSTTSGERASAGFRVWLLDVSSGATLWSASFDKTQKPLTSNLFQASSAFKQGLRFKNVQDLFSEGFKQAATNLQELRNTWIE